MPLQTVLEFLSQDPVLTYSLLAAAFLALVSLGSGWLRLDFLAVFSPRGLLHVSFAVLAALLLLVLARALEGSLLTPNSITATPLENLSRLPLYVVTLGYGPTAGLLGAALFAAFNAQNDLPSYPEAILALELIILGWLAIFPSSHTHRWAGPFNVLLAYLLASATAGLAVLQFSGAELSFGLLWQIQRDGVLGLLISLLVLLVLGPGFYRRIFELSRIRPKPAQAKPEKAAETLSLDDFKKAPLRLREAPIKIRLPNLERGKRKSRHLTPPPDFDANIED